MLNACSFTALKRELVKFVVTQDGLICRTFPNDAKPTTVT
jgi:hypothetical protein